MLNNRPQRPFLAYKPNKPLPSNRYQDLSDPFEDLSSETFIHKQSSAPTITRFRENLNLSCSFTGPFSPQTPLTPSPKNMLILNRRTLTKGYARFLEDREFLSHRDEERVKVEQTVKKAFANADPKIMSEDIQKLVSSAIVNEPSYKMKSLRKSAEIKNLTSKMPTLEERYKKICRRILGEDFESNELFIKEQEEAASMVRNGQLRKSENFEQCWKKARRSKITKPQSQVISIGGHETAKSFRRKLPRTVSAVSVPCDLAGIQVEKEETSVLDLTKSLYKGNGTLNSIDETESTGVAGEDEGGSEENLGKVRCQLSFVGVENSGISMGTTKKSSFRSQVSQGRGKSGSILEISEISVLGRSKVMKKSGVKENKDPNKEKEIAKIDLLCKGAMKITKKEGVKIRKRQLQVVKDYSKLDVEVEKLRFENTVENWEKSVREVYRIEQTSPFYNLVAL